MNIEVKTFEGHEIEGEYLFFNEGFTESQKKNVIKLYSDYLCKEEKKIVRDMLKSVLTFSHVWGNYHFKWYKESKGKFSHEFLAYALADCIFKTKFPDLMRGTVEFKLVRKVVLLLDCKAMGEATRIIQGCNLKTENDVSHFCKLKRPSHD